jgi:predicted acetyltransferase
LRVAVEPYDDEACTGIQVVVGDVGVSSLLIHDPQVRMGYATVRTGGMAAMETAEEHRGRGHARRVIEHAASHLHSEKTPLALLYGIEDFYDRFGYTPAVPSYGIRVRTEHIDVAEAPQRTVDCEPSHRAATADMYERNSRRRSGTIVRSTLPPESA